MGIRGRTLAVASAGMFLILLAAAAGLSMSWRSLQTFEQDVMNRQRDAVAVIAAESDFKKQVQEWKDTLLRGSVPEALDKHWGAFQRMEGQVRDETSRLAAGVSDPEAAKLLTQFVAAHQQMGAAYRAGFDQFKAANFDSRVGDKAVAGIDRGPTELLTKAKDRIQANAKEIADQAAESGRRGIFIALAVMVAATIVSLGVFTLMVSRTVISPISRTVHAMGRLAQGDLSVEIAANAARDEIGEMIRAVRVFKENAEEALRLRKTNEEQRRAYAEERAAALLRLADNFEATVTAKLSEVEKATAGIDVTAQDMARRTGKSGGRSLEMGDAVKTTTEPLASEAVI